VNVVVTDQHRLGLFDQTQPLGRAQPGLRGFGRGELLQDDSIDLGGRVGRDHLMIDKAWEASHDVAGAPLPRGKVVLTVGQNPRLRDDRD